METPKRPAAPETVPCAVCHREIPVSEAKSEEAVDYVLYFCGMDCYAKWKKQEKA
ncbi:MAG TPA: DUF3330 domain-containing protein [Burkholderiales bacterium]|nr:DUF3330 domain-containing protein [Burkholderiales bacterium]